MENIITFYKIVFLLNHETKLFLKSNEYVNYLQKLENVITYYHLYYYIKFCYYIIQSQSL